MLARVWRGVTAAEDAQAYLDYLGRTGLAEYRATPGNAGVLALRCVEGAQAEFVLVTLWTSMDAVQRFAGADAERAVFYPADDRFLVERDERVRHYDVGYQALEQAPEVGS